jgi:hypothetical protein
MSCLSLILDGMLSGTGLRDAHAGGYVEPEKIGVSASLRHEISMWLARYEQAHFFEYADAAVNESLDRDGIRIVRLLRSEFPLADIGYFSNAQLKNKILND